jgi:signal transduction histidine kinase
LSLASVLIVSDDTEFARSVAARWHAERRLPDVTLTSSDVWHPANAAEHELVVVGPVAHGRLHSILSALAVSVTAAVHVAADDKDAAQAQAQHPHLLVIQQRDGWADTLILVANEALRRAEAVHRAQRAERLALEGQGHAALGRYMLDMRPSVNNALTSVLGNADLLLLDPEIAPSGCREQIETIHAMALRLHEIMQRFSSLAAEMRAGEKESQAETAASSQLLVAPPSR